MSTFDSMLVLGADTRGLAKAEVALDSIAAKGANAEAKIKTSMAKAAAALKAPGIEAQASAIKMSSAATTYAAGADAIASKSVLAGNNSRMMAMQFSQVAQQTSASGNFIQALAIQLPDLALGFGTVGIAAGILGSIALPLVASMFGAAGDAANRLSGLMDDLNASVSEMNNISKSYSSDGLQAMVDKYGEVNAQLLTMKQRLDDIAKQRAMDASIAAIAALKEQMAGAIGNSGALGRAGAQAAGEINKATGLTLGQLKALNVAFRDVSAAKSFGEQEAALARVNDILALSTLKTGELAEAALTAQDMIAQLANSAPKSTWLAGAASGLSDMIDKMSAAIPAQIKLVESANTSGATLLETMRQQNEMTALSLKYGADSAQVAEYRHGIERAALVTDLERKGVSASIANDILTQADNAYTLARAIDFAGGATGGLISRIAGIAAALAPAITAARALADAMASAASQFGGVGAALARMSAAGSGIMASGSALGKLFNPAALRVATGLIDKAKGGILKLQSAAVSAAASGKDFGKVLASQGWKGFEEDIAGKGGKGGAAGAAKKLADEMEAALKEAERLRIEMERPLTTAIGTVADAWGDFITGGLKNFKGFAKSVLSSFKQMISTMISTAASKKLMGLLGLGVSATGGAAAAGVAGGAAGAAAGAGSTLMSGASLLSGIGGIGSAFMSGATGLLTGGLGGVTTAMGAATGALGSFAAAAGAIAVPLLAVGAVFSFFKGKTKELDGGLRVTVAGMESLIETFKTTEKSRFWGLSKKTSTNFSAAEGAVADPVTKLLTSLQTGIMATAASLKIGGDAFKGFNKVLEISTKGLTNDQIMEELQKQIASLGDSFAGMVPALKSVQRDGEGAMDALNRIATSLAAVNPVMRDLGLQTYQVGVKGAAAASKLVDLYGGLQGFADATTYYFENFYSLGKQSRIVARQFSEAVGALNIGKVPQTAKEFKALVDRLNDAGKSAKAAGLIQLAPLFDKMKGLQQSIDKTGAAAEKAAAKLEKQAAKAAAIADQRAGLERRLLELQGNTAALRKLDLAALYQSNRALQKQILAQEKANEAADKAAEAAQAAADKAAAVLDQRLGLEGKLLELQGNTAELRRRELAALDPTNRALQQMIWGLEDAKSAMDALDPNDFATKFEFLKAQAMARNIVTPISTVSPIYSVSAGAKPQDSGNVIELRAVVAEIKAFREEQRQLSLASSTDNRKTANVLRKWDADGMPAERV